MYPDNWLRLTLYPITDALGIGFHPTFQVLWRSFSTHGQQEMKPKQMQTVLGHEDSRTTQEIYTQTVDCTVMRRVNEVANRLLQLDAPPALDRKQ
jgi:integrase